MQTKLTTLCYLERDEHYLMLHRIKKHEDINKGKWIGPGGKFERGESPEEMRTRGSISLARNSETELEIE